MVREPLIPVEGEAYAVESFIMESAKEMQEWDKYLPATDDLPTTHEHYVENVIEKRNGIDLAIKRVSVRRKLDTAKPVTTEPDNLNALDAASLDIQAAQAGIAEPEWKKLKTPAARVARIREERAKKQPVA